MSKPECRESRKVPYDPTAIVWGCAFDGVIASADVDKQGRLESPVAPTEKRLLPYERQLPPGALGGSVAAVWGSVANVRESVCHAPLVPVSGNKALEAESVDVVKKALSREVRALEHRVESLSKRVKAQDSLIGGFCKLKVAEGQ
jgi:hypothetical protein